MRRKKKKKIKVGHKKKPEGAIYEEYESNINVIQGPDYVYLVFWLVFPGCLDCFVFDVVYGGFFVCFGYLWSFSF